jgi:hypothetical protein
MPLPNAALSPQIKITRIGHPHLSIERIDGVKKDNGGFFFCYPK